jgi:Kef-type K+ transport system membrane component KefB
MPGTYPIFWILVAAVAAPLLSEIPLGIQMPIVVIEVILGVVIGPHSLDLVHFDGFIVTMFTLAMATTLFMAGMELNFGEIKGRPLSLAVGGWSVSLLLGIAVVVLLRIIPQVHAPLMVTLGLCTTGLGVMIPVFLASGQLGTPFGRLFLAAGTLGEIGPIVAMSLLLSQQYSTWQEVGFLCAFLAIVSATVVVGVGAREPQMATLLSRHTHAISQLPVRISLLMLATLFVLAERFGFESILGAFAAGMIVGQATRGAGGRPLREKINAVCVGWFFPFFFVGTGIKFNIAALGQDLPTMLLVPTFVILFLIVRGVPVLLYRKDLAIAQRLAFALSSAVPSLSIIVVITEIGARAKAMNPDVAAGLTGAALLSVMLFPTMAGALLFRAGSAAPSTGGPL